MFHSLIILTSLLFTCSIHATQKIPIHRITNATIDARVFLQNRSYNKQDKNGNTFLHQIALSCNRFSEWKEISQEMQQFADKNGGNMPNPLLENNERATARKLAKIEFDKYGNPICGTLILFLREAEFMYLDRCSSQEGRIELSKK